MIARSERAVAVSLSFQVVQAVVYLTLAVWEYLIVLDPAPFSEYSPKQNTVMSTSLLVASFIIFGAIWLMIAYFSYREKWGAFIGAIGFGAFEWILLYLVVPAAGLYKYNFSDLLDFPILILTIYFSYRAYVVVESSHPKLQ